MNLKTKIIGHETGVNNKIFYLVQVIDTNSDCSQVTKLRYSQFRQIHEEIEKIVSKHKLRITLPEFPSRKVFSSTNKSLDKICERKNQLNNYLASLLSLQKLYCLQIIKKYFIPDQSGTSAKTQAEISIDRYTLVNDVIVYYVRIKNLNTSQEWTFKTRYSELRNVHDALLQTKIKCLPEFPKKKLLGNTNQNPQDIETRREELERYFNEIFRNQQVIRSEALKYFVQESRKQAAKDKQLQTLKKKCKST